MYVNFFAVEGTMKILAASDSFKGTLSSETVGKIIKSALIDNKVDVISISDGGEGIIEALENKLDGKRINISIKDPLGRPIEGYYFLTDNGVAIIESAIACGLALLSEEERNPLFTSTYGLGMMIEDAIFKTAKHILIGIGGSSTNDCGLGMLEALGVRFFDKSKSLLGNLSGKDLGLIESFDTTELNKLLEGISIEVACDVDNPLLGKDGATYTFAPQKGADDEMCEVLEKGMIHFSTSVSDRYGYKADFPGAGAAGGLGFCFNTFFSGSLKNGIDLVLDVLHFDDWIADYDLVITGEGKIDGQTSRGKVPQGILNRTSRKGIRTIAICGIKEAEVKEFDAVFSVVPTIATAEESLGAPEFFLNRLIKEYVKPWIRQKN